MITVLLVDDEELVRTGLRMILDAEPDITVVGQATDGAEGLQQARQLDPDVVLMDIRMPNVDGLEATRHLASDAIGPRVVILTTFDLDEHVYESLRAGASGFLLKDVPAHQLVHAVRVAASGDALLAPIHHATADQHLRPAPRTRQPRRPSRADPAGPVGTRPHRPLASRHPVTTILFGGAEDKVAGEPRGSR